MSLYFKHKKDNCSWIYKFHGGYYDSWRFVVPNASQSFGWFLNPRKLPKYIHELYLRTYVCGHIFTIVINVSDEHYLLPHFISTLHQHVCGAPTASELKDLWLSVRQSTIVFQALQGQDFQNGRFWILNTVCNRCIFPYNQWLDKMYYCFINFMR